MKLSPDTLERHRQRVEERQQELQFNIPPMTVNRAKDFNAAPPCTHCQRECQPCRDYLTDHR